jgi:RNA:NAD 2'-phosphotransferase (TPT1/KptA family)
MDTAGFVKLDELLPYLKGKGFHDVDEDAIRNIVDNNDKKRF